MPTSRPLLRWLPTFLAFPLAGLLTIATVGSLTSVAEGLLAGALAGAVVGGAQWLALRSSGIGRAWWLATVVAASAGTALAVAVTGAGTSGGDLLVRGVVTGAAIGLAQGLVVRRSALAVAGWTLVTSTAWGLGWFITARVIVDAERGYVVFGSSGALLATVLTGLALPLVLRRRQAAIAPSDVDLAAVEVAR
jgi:hypothetical protein